MIKRKKYLEDFEKYINTPVVKVITGMRRVGKSSFFRQIITVLKEDFSIPDSDIIFIDKDDFAFSSITNEKELYAYIEEKTRHITHRKKYIFIDEIQDISNWELVVRSFVQKSDFDVYITGSNAKLLSSELSTYLTGRYVEFPLLPLGFSEFLEFRKNPLDKVSEFKNYLKYGGLPALHNMEFSDEMIRSYQDSVFDSLIFRDIVDRYNIRNIASLKNILAFLAENIGNIVSTQTIQKTLMQNAMPISPEKVYEYLEYFQNTYLFSEMKRYDVKGKKILERYEKYYAYDLGIINYFFGFSEKNIGRKLENIVYLELKRRGYIVYIGKMYDTEIDFVAEKNGERLYVQVAFSLADEQTLERELRSLEKITDNYPKILLSLDAFGDFSRNGIGYENIIDWLLRQ